MKKEFSMSDILTVYTGKLYSKIDKLYEILNFLCQENLMTHHLPVAANFVKQGLISQLTPAQQDICIGWIHTDDWEEKVKEVDTLFGKINLFPIDKTGFETFMIENSLLK